MSVTKMIAALVNVVAAGLIISGCTSERFGAPYSNTTPRSAPIRAAPSDSVSQTPLAPPEGYSTEYPSAPLGGDGTQMAGLDPQPQGSWDAITSGIELTPALVAGVWRAEVDGLPCQIATPMTKFGQGFRAGPMRCPVALSNVNAWNVQGQELIFYNRDGAPQATLYSTNGTSFVGRSQDGAQIILTR